MEKEKRSRSGQHMKKISHQKRGIIFSGWILMAIILAVLIECFFFNFNYFKYGNIDANPPIYSMDNIETQEDGSYYLVDNSKTGTIILNLTELRGTKLTVNVEGEIPTGNIYNVSSNDTLLGSRRADQGTKIINVGKNNGHLSLEFSQLDHSFELALRVKNYFEFNKIRFLALVLSFLILLIAIYLIYQKKYALFSLTVILTFGLVSSFLTPPNFTFDEAQHFLKAMSVADGNLFFENGDIIEVPHGMDEVASYNNEGKTYSSYEEFKNFFAHFNQNEYHQIEKKAVSTTASTYLFVPYLFSALGIIVAKILGANVLFYLWLARLANLIGYAFLAYLAIKRMPRQKILLTFLTIQPVLIYLGSSLGFDSLICGLIFLGVAEIYRIKTLDIKVSLKSFLLIAICFTLIVIAKVAYAPILLLFFMIKKGKFKERWQCWGSYLGLSILLFIVAIATYQYSNNLGLNQWNMVGVDSALQLNTILANPLWYLKVIVHFFSENFSLYFDSMVGFYGYLQGASPILTGLNWLTLGILAVFGMTGQEQEDLVNYTDFRDKSLTVFSGICMAGLTATALYMSFTRVGSPTVAGYQPRYLLPILFPVLLILPSPKIRHSFSYNRMEKIAFSFGLFLCLIYMWCNIMAVFYF